MNPTAKFVIWTDHKIDDVRVHLQSLWSQNAEIIAIADLGLQDCISPAALQIRLPDYRIDGDSDRLKAVLSYFCDMAFHISFIHDSFGPFGLGKSDANTLDDIVNYEFRWENHPQINFQYWLHDPNVPVPNPFLDLAFRTWSEAESTLMPMLEGEDLLQRAQAANAIGSAYEPVIIEASLSKGLQITKYESLPPLAHMFDMMTKIEIKRRGVAGPFLDPLSSLDLGKEMPGFSATEWMLSIYEQNSSLEPQTRFGTLDFWLHEYADDEPLALRRLIGLGRHGIVQDALRHHKLEESDFKALLAEVAKHPNRRLIAGPAMEKLKEIS